MDIKKHLKTYSFWIAVLSGLFLLVQFVFKCFGIVITKEGYMSVINGVLAVFVMVGILTPPPQMTTSNDDQQKTSEVELSQKNQNLPDLKTETKVSQIKAIFAVQSNSTVSQNKTQEKQKNSQNKTQEQQKEKN